MSQRDWLEFLLMDPVQWSVPAKELFMQVRDATLSVKPFLLPTHFRQLFVLSLSGLIASPQKALNLSTIYILFSTLILFLRNLKLSHR